MDYNIVYIATKDEISLWIFTVPIIFLLISVGILIYVIRGRRRVQLKGLSCLIFPIIFATFSILMTYSAALSFFNTEDPNSEIFLNGDYKVVEGVIENFDRMPYGGHRNESFYVNGVFFEYSDYGGYGGINHFNHTASHGGPIRKNGQQVRLSYITWGEDTNLILKVEIANEQ